MLLRIMAVIMCGFCMGAFFAGGVILGIAPVGSNPIRAFSISLPEALLLALFIVCVVCGLLLVGKIAGVA